MKTVLLAAAMLLFVAFPGAALVIVDDEHPAFPGDSQPDLYQIVNQLYGTSFGSSADMSGFQVEPSDQSFTTQYEVTVRALWNDSGAVVEQIGWFNLTATGRVDHGTFHPMWTDTDTGTGNFGGGTVTSSDEYGFYLREHNEADSYYWYFSVEGTVNGGNMQFDRMVTYDLGELTGNSLYDGHLLCGWETGGTNDLHDYNELVMELGSPVVPEPATLVVLSIGLAGLLCRRLRKS